MPPTHIPDFIRPFICCEWSPLTETMHWWIHNVAYWCVLQENSQQEITRRPRSPSPFAAGRRSRSLGARRFGKFSTAPSGEQQEHNSSFQNTTNGGPPHPESEDRRRSLGMSTASELPPIGPGARPESVRSKRSSRDSSAGAPKGIHRYEKPELLSVGSFTDSGAVPKRSHHSPGSTDSSNSKSVSNNSGNLKNPGFLKHRNKTWCATETNTGHNPKLETLFERNGVSQRTRGTGAVTNRGSTAITRMRNHRFASTDSASPSGANPSLSKRTTSLSDLTTLNKNNNSRPKVRRFQGGRSEQNMDRPTTSMTPRRSSLTTAGAASARRQTASGRPALNHSVSQPLSKRQQQLNDQDLRNGNGLSPGSPESDSDFINERILSWLQGVTCDAPPTEDVAEEEPPQTDTAIHIVYQGDWRHPDAIFRILRHIRWSFLARCILGSVAFAHATF